MINPGCKITGTGQQQAALSSAGALAPEATRYEAFGGVSMTPQSVAAQYAQQVQGQKMSPEQARSEMSSLFGGAGDYFLNQALQGGGYNYITGGAQAAGQASTLASVPGLESANTAAEGIKNTITSYLNSNPQLNPTDLAATNFLQQWIEGKQLTDPKYQTLFNYLNEYTNTLAPILGVGGSSTNLKTEIAQGFINARASGKSIIQVLNDISKLASDKIQNIKSGATGGGVVSSPSTSGGSITTKASDGNTYEFYQDASGKWVAK